MVHSCACNFAQDCRKHVTTHKCYCAKGFQEQALATRQKHHNQTADVLLQTMYYIVQTSDHKVKLKIPLPDAVTTYDIVKVPT